MLAADHYTPVDDTLIPTGEIAPVAGTPFDFREFHKIGERVDQLDDKPGEGYDHNFVLNNQDGKLALAAKVRDPKSGRVLTRLHDRARHPVLRRQFPRTARRARAARRTTYRSGFCLETQHYPELGQPADSSRPSFLRPGETYKHTCVYQITAWTE